MAALRTFDLKEGNILKPKDNRRNDLWRVDRIDVTEVATFVYLVEVDEKGKLLERNTSVGSDALYELYELHQEA